MIDITMYPEQHNCSGCAFWNARLNPIHARIAGRPGTVEVAQCLAANLEDDAPYVETQHDVGYVFTPASACCNAFRIHPDLEADIIAEIQTYRELDIYMARQAV